MSAEQIALVPRCTECKAHWLSADRERWQAHLGGDDLDEPPEVFFYCLRCAEPSSATDLIGMVACADDKNQTPTGICIGGEPGSFVPGG